MKQRSNQFNTLARVAMIVSRLAVTVCLFAVVDAKSSWAADTQFEVGFARRDITPAGSTPMWGYAARKAALSAGTLDPLYADAIVIRAGETKLALVGLDLGRGPTVEMMEVIREAISSQAGIEHVMAVGSHTHHGPVIELKDKEGFGRGKFDAAVTYAKRLPELISEAILEADANLASAKMGVATAVIDFNRNRHTKREPKATDPMLAVIRFTTLADEPIATVVNFAAHPVMTEVMNLRFSADYPGFMKRKVEETLGGACIFMQGAAGDMSTKPADGRRGPQQYGEALAAEVSSLARGIDPEVPETASIKAKVNRFRFGTRVDLGNPLIRMGFSQAFFPELVKSILDEFEDGVETEMVTVLINDELAFVGGSGEFFCNHSNRLKSRSYVDTTLFFGYCNRHSFYVPTIEAASEGGYGADPTVSFVELGAGEQMMNQALINLYGMLERFDTKPAVEASPLVGE